MMSMNLSDIAILNNESADYCCIISGISKSEAINLMQNIDLTKKRLEIYYHIWNGEKNYKHFIGYL